MRRPALFSLLLLAACGSDSGTSTLPPPPVATVEIVGTSRVKVGDSYHFSVEARTADGTQVIRPVDWSVIEIGKASIGQGGNVTPTAVGTITLRAVVEGVTATVLLTGYDWIPVQSGTTIGAGILADEVITNNSGTSEYAGLVIGCVDGTFVAGVGTQHFVTRSGAVTYAFDGGAAITDAWLETDDFSGLGYRGSTNLSRKSFAVQISQHTRFNFSFGEFQGPTVSTMFRVTGLAPYLVPILAACPSNAVREPYAIREPYSEALTRLRQLVAASQPRR